MSAVVQQIPVQIQNNKLDVAKNMLKAVEQTFEIAGDDMVQLVGPMCELLTQIITNPQCTESLKKISVQLFEIMCGTKGAKR